MQTRRYYPAKLIIMIQIGCNECVTYELLSGLLSSGDKEREERGRREGGEREREHVEMILGLLFPGVFSAA